MSGDVLEGKRLLLRPVAQNDIPALFEWYRDPKLLSLYDGIPFSAESLDVFRDQYSFWLDNDVALDLAGAFIMVLRETKAIVGECSWMLVDRTGPDSPGIFQVGGLVGPGELRGKGLGTEALRLLRDYLFRERGAHRLEALTVAFNTGAMKTLHHNGFSREGVLREAVLVDGEWRDRVMFSLLRREWEEGAKPRSDFPAD
jgi:RimJ/RimL family protein N-acetyltransferase